MDNLTDKEIQKASNAIDKAFAAMTRQNRGETAQLFLTLCAILTIILRTSFGVIYIRNNL